MNDGSIFVDAMREVVAERGEGYRFPRTTQAPEFYVRGTIPAYVTQGGEGACLIGAALLKTGAMIYRHNTDNAFNVLLMQGYPDAVAFAARAAQVHQDRRGTWGEALAVFEWVLDAVKKGQYVPILDQAMVAYGQACWALGILMPVPEVTLTQEDYDMLKTFSGHKVLVSA